MMSMAHLDDVRCTDLVLGLLAPAEREQAIAHATACQACAARLRRHAGAQMAWRTAAAPTASSAHRRSHWPVLWAAVAGLIAVVALPRWWRPPVTPATPGTAPRLVAPAEGVLVREGEVEDPHLRAGLEAYAAGRLEEADRELAQATATGPADEARRLYLAQVKMLRGDKAAALTLLRSVRWASLPAHVGRDAVALYVQVLRANEQRASADSLEQALERTPEWQPLRP